MELEFLLELVSKELNHFDAIVSFFRDWAPGTLKGANKSLFMRSHCYFTRMNLRKMGPF